MSKTIFISDEIHCRLNKIRSELLLSGRPNRFKDVVEFLLNNKCSIEDVSCCPVVAGDDADKLSMKMIMLMKKKYGDKND